MVTVELTAALASSVAKLVHAEAVKVGRELMKARDDWEAARRHHELVGDDVSARILNNSVRLVCDLTDEARALLQLSRDLAGTSTLDAAVRKHGHCSQ